MIVQDAPIYTSSYTEKSMVCSIVIASNFKNHFLIDTSAISVHDTKKLVISKDQSLNYLPVKAKRKLFESSSSQGKKNIKTFILSIRKLN